MNTLQQWNIKPGNIPAICHVTHPNGQHLDYVYIADNKQPEGTPLTNAYCPWRELPVLVRDAINEHFGVLFALPIERREKYLRDCTPWNIPVATDKGAS